MGSAVLFLVFNRPEETRRSFAAIRRARPSRLYISADGPRRDRPCDTELCEKVRGIATSVDWPCEVYTLFRKWNLGCKEAVSSGITWFFGYEEQGIVLEDDCIPGQEFFAFADTLLPLYADDERVWVITGNNYQSGIRRGDASYYFSKYNHCWGWASWRRAWSRYDGSLSFWPQWRNSADWKQSIPDRVERKYWARIFDRVFAEEVDSWAYPWTACLWYYGGLTATPNTNLVTNIGFGPAATHTKVAGKNMARETGHLGEITHPEQVIRNEDADWYLFDHHFGGHERRGARNIVRLLKLNVRRMARKLI